EADAADTAAPLLRPFRRDLLVGEERGGLVGFFCGFLSPSDSEEGGVRFSGVDPAHRGEGLAPCPLRTIFRSCSGTRSFARAQRDFTHQPWIDRVPSPPGIRDRRAGGQPRR